LHKDWNQESGTSFKYQFFSFVNITLLIRKTVLHIADILLLICYYGFQLLKFCLVRVISVFLAKNRKL